MHKRMILIAAVALVAAPAAAQNMTTEVNADNAMTVDTANTMAPAADNAMVAPVNADELAAAANPPEAAPPAPRARPRERSFPYGLIGLVGLIGLLGRRRRAD